MTVDEMTTKEMITDKTSIEENVCRQNYLMERMCTK